MKERLLETIKYYEKKQIYQEKRLKKKLDKGGIEYERI
jgi:hypothetical protein